MKNRYCFANRIRSIPISIFLLSILMIWGCSNNAAKQIQNERPKAMKTQVFTNRLINEKSPYLLQHAHNPVDWYPWGEEAFNKARTEDRPIFLSIGYSTCHWCHVMEKESFSNTEIAKILNENFISIKVDREERPDIDAIYMKAVQLMTGSGGWPLTVVLNHGLEPFFAGTYFPPDDRWGRPGLKKVLLAIANSWDSERDAINRSGESITEQMKIYSKISEVEPVLLGEDVLHNAYQLFESDFDKEHGGFGSAPKFPMGHSMSFLLRYYKRTDKKQSLEIVEKTLSEIASGGIFDHLEGGFHRYSTDAHWHVPHFEKMLYDQALLSRAYVEAYQVTHKDEYRGVGQKVLDYVLDVLRDPKGAFYSAQDADSAEDPRRPEEKSEGAYYVWTQDEIVDILGPEAAEIFNYYYGVKREGNVLSDPHGVFIKKNILYVEQNASKVAQKFKKSDREIALVLNEARRKLKAARAQRPEPYLDDKILTDWNGLVISSLAYASAVFDDERYLNAAKDAAGFIFDNMLDDKGNLLHRYRDGEAGITASLNDYAFFVHGLLDLYEACFEIKYLRNAIGITKEMIRRFSDKDEGGFFMTPEGAENLLFRQKEIYDGAMPSGNSIAALNLVRLAALTMDKEFDDQFGKLTKMFGAVVRQSPTSFAQFLNAVDFMIGPSKEIAVVGEASSSVTAGMLKAIRRSFLPNKILALKDTNSDSDDIVSMVPFMREQISIQGKTTVYVCENYVCAKPVTALEELKSLLE